MLLKTSADMKKYFKATLCLFAIVVHVSMEFYPAGKVLVKRHLAEVDFEKALSMKEVSKNLSFLSEEEKKRIVELLENLYNNQTK